MIPGIIAALAGPIIGAAAGSVFGGGGGAKAEIPPDLKALRSEQIDLLRYLLGYGNLNEPTAFTGPQNPLNVPYLDTPEPQSPWDQLRDRWLRREPQSPWDQWRPEGAQGGGAFPQMPQQPMGGATPPPGWGAPVPGQPFGGGAPTGGLTPGNASTPTGGLTPGNATGPRPEINIRPNIDIAGTGTAGGAGAPGGNLQTQRLEQFFGPLGMPQSALQQQAVGQIGTFLSDANSPFNRTQQQSFDVLGNILGSNPGQPVIDALQPSFQRNLAEANQQGGRFGTANAVLRSRALDDFNLLGAQAAQQGVNQQMQAANLGNILGNDQLARLAGIFGIGGQEAQQADVETQRRIQLLQSLMATAQGAAFGQPVSVTPSGAQQGLQAGMQFASLLPFLL